MKKLSKRQHEIINLLSSGWEMGWSMAMDGLVWIQKGGAGCGGESKTVSVSTACALLNMGLIERIGNRFPIARYRLTDQANAWLEYKKTA